MLVALLALFIALGGPAAGGAPDHRQGHQEPLGHHEDLSKKAVKTLRTTPRGSVKERALANGAVTSGKLRDGAVTTGKIARLDRLGADAPNAVGPRELMRGGVVTAALADNAVTGSKVADGSLDARDIDALLRPLPGRATSRQIDRGTCWSGEPRGLAPELAGADISQDLVLVTPDKDWPQDQLVLHGQELGEPAACSCSPRAT